ncbi:MAG: putative DNA-binding domain-containing protein [Haliea sp.]
MPAPDHFQQVQYAFTQHLRDPDNVPAPADIEPRRMAIYERLLFKNVEDFLVHSFPVIRKLTADDRWLAMIRDYFKHHQARNPLFPRMPLEFLEYLEHERDDPADPPWLLELAHYEWMETAMAIDPREIELAKPDVEPDWLNSVPVLSPVMTPLVYRWPVHMIGHEYQPDTPPDQPTYLVIYRDRDDKVGFLELNPVSARLIALIQATPRTGRELLQQIATELNHPNPDVVISGGLDIFRQLFNLDIILATTD